MKRIFIIIFIVVFGLSIKNVYAENYKIKELIPYGIDTTIHTNNFSYKGIYFDRDGVHFNGIKNLTDEKIPISISIGLFNGKGKNIGVINYCDLSLEGKDEMSFFIEFTDEYLGENVENADIRYMAVLGDNITCKVKGSRDYIGQSVDKMGISHNNKFDNQTELLLSILTILGACVAVLILYRVLFTNKYKNIDGKIVRKSFDEINKELKEKREEELLKNPPKKVEKQSDKPIEILQQEENAKEEDKSDTDLHNLYK